MTVLMKEVLKVDFITVGDIGTAGKVHAEQFNVIFEMNPAA